jgi:hypothetical protein
MRSSGVSGVRSNQPSVVPTWKDHQSAAHPRRRRRTLRMPVNVSDTRVPESSNG